MIRVRFFSSPLQGIISLSYTLLLFATLPRTPEIIKWIDGTGQMKLVLSTLFSVISFIIIYFAIRAGRFAKPSFWLTIAFLAAVYVGSVRLMTTAPERMHLLTYGLMGLLVFSTARFWLEGRALFFVSLAAVSAVGVLDEVVQYFLPNRYFGFDDIVLNIMGGISGLMIVRYVLGDRGDKCEA